MNVGFTHPVAWKNSRHAPSWRFYLHCGNEGTGSISNNSSFCQKHPGVPDGSDGSDGTSYPLTENYTLPVAHATHCVAYVPPLRCGDIYAPSEGLVCYTLRRVCTYAEAIYTTPGDVKSYLLLLIQRFSKLMRLVCILIYVSMYLSSYLSTQGISGRAARGDCQQFEVPLKMMTG